MEFCGYDRHHEVTLESSLYGKKTNQKFLKPVHLLDWRHFLQEENEDYLINY